MSARILIIDDEDILREDLAALLRDEGYSCRTASDGEEGVRLAEDGEPDVVLCDLVMPGIGGVEVVNRLAAARPELPVILITAHGTMETALEAFRAGAVDYLLKPVLSQDLIVKIRRCLEHRRLLMEVRHLRREVSDLGTGTRLIGEHPSIAKVRELIQRVASTDSTILITGESGTGKEVVARAIHEAGPGTGRPFVPLNCASLPRELFESELFGHMRGAFTGAVRDKPGQFELAAGGTLFLDEIGELPTEVQPKLLRAIEQKEFTRVGGTRTVEVRTRVVASTNRELKSEVAEGRFREDLWYRLRVVEIDLLPLRERRDDIPLLVEHFVSRLNGRLKRRVLGVDRPAMRVLMSASWRGNARELQNVLERAMIFADGDFIGIGDLPAELAGSLHCPTQSDDLRTAVRAYEREHIRQVLASVDGNKEEAARRLGVNASTLYRRLKSLDD
jgi:two-component system response regulator PilR (NtrC family)